MPRWDFCETSIIMRYPQNALEYLYDQTQKPREWHTFEHWKETNKPQRSYMRKEPSPNVELAKFCEYK